MIKNYKLFTESLLDKLKGPSDEEILNILNTLDDSEKIIFIITKLDESYYKYLPDNLTIDGNLNCSEEQLTSLPDNLTIKGGLNCSYNQLTSLPENLVVNGSLDCSFNKLTKLPENLTVNGDLYCDNNLKELEIPSSTKIKGKIYND